MQAKNRNIAVLLMAVAFTLLFSGVAYADEDAVKRAAVSFKETGMSILVVVVLVIGIIELTKRQISAAISLILAAVLIYAAASTDLLQTIGTTVAGWFGASPTK
jgi:TRAP-type uncharacterized transport system fused permease subunit